MHELSKDKFASLHHLMDHPQSVVNEEALTFVALHHAPRQPYSIFCGYAPFAVWLSKTFDRGTQLSLDRTLGSIRMRYLRTGLTLTEEQVRIRDSAFHSYFAHYRLKVFESVPHAVAIVSRTGFMFAGNTRLLEWFQLPSAELLSGNVLYFSLVAKPDVPKVLEAYRKATDTLAQALHESPFLEAYTDRSVRDSCADAGYAVVTHEFVVNREQYLCGTRAWNEPEMDEQPIASQRLPGSTSSVVRVRGHVTLQAVSAAPGADIPLFLALFVACT